MKDLGQGQTVGQRLHLGQVGVLAIGVVYHYVIIFLLRVLRVVQEQHQALHLQGLQDQHQCGGLC